MNILITGKPGSGKTTLIKRILKKYTNAGGFYTEEIRVGGRREGFKIISLDGKESILAHVNIDSKYRISKYGVDLKSIDEIGVSSILKAIEENDLIIIDEIGKMELFSSNFRHAVNVALNSKKVVLATILLSSHPFTDKIKRRNDVKLFYLTPENREEIEKEIHNLLKNL